MGKANDVRVDNDSFISVKSVPEDNIGRLAANSRQIVQFLHLGRLGERKGAYDLVNAFAGLPEGLRNRARLVMAGDGDVEGVRQMADPLGSQPIVPRWRPCAGRGDATSREGTAAEATKEATRVRSKAVERDRHRL